MSSTAKAHEPTMEEILASIRRIIADDEPVAEAKAAPAPPPAAAKPAAAPKPAPAPEPVAADEPADGELNQDDIDAMLASFDSPPVPGKEPPAAKTDDDVLELTKPVSKAAPLEAVPGEIEFRDAIASAKADADEDMAGWGLEPEPEPVPEPVAMATHQPAVTRSVEEALLAPEAGSAVANAFSSLAHTILGQNARTLDDLVAEMLRPMLKSWLDDNLPTIVERLVRAEIERVSRGAPRR
jgi:cell pole-organizing protein PopZ